MTADELVKEGAIYVKSIGDGLRNYQSEFLVLNGKEAEELFFKMWKTSGNEHSFVDFYYFSLPEEAKSKVNLKLTMEEKLYLDSYRVKEGEVFFPLDEMLLRIVVKLNECEMLFSTFYFTNPQSTWWGNYNKEYIHLYEH